MIDNILEERKKTHGDFIVQSHISQTLKDICKPHTQKLTNQQKEALDMILHKIARILVGNPNYIDHWRDISAYSKLIIRELEKSENAIDVKLIYIKPKEKEKKMSNKNGYVEI